MAKEIRWESIHREEGRNGKEQTEFRTERMKVPGGWVLRTIVRACIPGFAVSNLAVHQLFIDDRDHSWAASSGE
jgi:hypothetical protein